MLTQTRTCHTSQPSLKNQLALYSFRQIAAIAAGLRLKTPLRCREGFGVGSSWGLNEQPLFGLSTLQKVFWDKT